MVFSVFFQNVFFIIFAFAFFWNRYEVLKKNSQIPNNRLKIFTKKWRKLDEVNGQNYRFDISILKENTGLK